MLITESQMSVGRISTSNSILDKMNYLTEADISYAPAMVPVVENVRFKKNLIDLENLVSFAEANNITDLGYAVQLICEADDLDPSTIGFAVSKVSIIEDTEICELADSLIQENVAVVVKPTNKLSSAYILGEMCLDVALESGDFSLLDAYVDNSIFDESQAFDKYRDMVAKAKKERGDTRSEEEIKAELANKGFKDLKAEYHYGKEEEDMYRRDAAAGRRLDASMKKNKETFDKNNEGKVTDTGTSPTENATVNQIQNIQKEWKSKPRKWFAEKIAWLHDKAQEFNNKIRLGGENVPWYKKILSYITRAIAFLTRHLHNFVAEKGHEISDVKGAYSSFHKAKA